MGDVIVTGVFATLLIYWTGWQTTWRVDAAILAGFVLLAISFLSLPRETRPRLQMRHSLWLWPYFAGLALLSVFGAFAGGDSTTLLDRWYHPVSTLAFPYDTVWEALFALAIFYLARATALPGQDVQEYIAAGELEVTTAEVTQVPEAV